MTAIVVEDDPAFALLLQAVIRPVFPTTVHIESLEDFRLFYVQARHIDLLILDLWLSDSSIARTLAEIQPFKAVHPETAILAISGHETPPIIDRLAKQAGADASCHKTEASKQALLTAVCKAIQRNPTTEALHNLIERMTRAE